MPSQQPASLRNIESRAAWGMLAPAMTLLIIFIVVPFFLAFLLSLTNERLIPRPIPTKWTGIRNYIRVLTDPDFWQALRNTFWFTFFIVPVQSSIGLGLALLINRQFKGNHIFRGIYFLPTVVPMVMVAIIWAGLLQAPEGVINGILRQISFDQIGPYDWLHHEWLAMPTIMLMSTWQGVGFQMIIYLAGLQNIPKELYEAARIDGANLWQLFWFITLPLLRNTHIVVLITTTILAFKLFTQVEVLTQGGPLGATNSLVRYIYVAGFQYQKVGLAAAASVIFFLIVLAIALCQHHLIQTDKD
ncbi:MAG: sugar ABC transporter permease [SAR324 cluster bacterium]|nr:sugar ABC transporter permease [SAR324 cluster bacterium]